MRIVDGLMEVGEFAFDLRAETPKSVRDVVRAATLARDGYVVAFDTPVTVPTLAQAFYVGALTRRVGRFSFEGMGLAGLMQDNNNLGEHVTANTAYASQTLSDWYTDLLPFGGITKGTVTNTGTSAAATWVMGLGLREMLDYVTSLCGGVWKMNTDGSIDAAAPATLFGSTPTVLITDDLTTEVGGSLTGIRGGIVGLLEDASQIAKRTIGYGEGEGTNIEIATTTASGTLLVGLDGASMQTDRPIDLPDSSGTELSSLTAAASARYDEARRSFLVEGATTGVRTKIQPGDPIYVYDLDADVTDSTNFVTFAGEGIQPLEVRVMRMEFGLHRGQGCWLYRPAEASPWTDLTEYMPFSFGADYGGFRLTVATDLGVADLVKIIGPDRVGIVRPDAPLPDPVTPGGGGGGGGGVRYGGSGYDRQLTSQEELDMFGGFGPGPRTVRDTVEQFDVGSNTTTRVAVPPSGSTVLGGP